jgi:hypothetical protein
MATVSPAQQHKEQQCIDLAMRAGIKYSIGSFLVSSVSVYAANTYSAGFRKYFNVSSKMALVVTPTLGAAFLASEYVLLRSQRDPEAYGIELWDENNQVIVPAVRKNYVSQLGLHHRAANWAYDNPFRILGFALVPIVGSVFFGQTGSEKTHLKFSQKVMHTRIFSQATVISTLLALMVFRDYMDTNGKFREEGEEDTKLSAAQEEMNNKLFAQELIAEAAKIHNMKSPLQK